MYKYDLQNQITEKTNNLIQLKEILISKIQTNTEPSTIFNNTLHKIIRKIEYYELLNLDDLTLNTLKHINSSLDFLLELSSDITLSTFISFEKYENNIERLKKAFPNDKLIEFRYKYLLIIRAWTLGNYISELPQSPEIVEQLTQSQTNQVSSILFYQLILYTYYNTTNNTEDLTAIRQKLPPQIYDDYLFFLKTITSHSYINIDYKRKLSASDYAISTILNIIQDNCFGQLSKDPYKGFSISPTETSLFLEPTLRDIMNGGFLPNISQT